MLCVYIYIYIYIYIHTHTHTHTDVCIMNMEKIEKQSNPKVIISYERKSMLKCFDGEMSVDRTTMDVL